MKSRKKIAFFVVTILVFFLTYCAFFGLEFNNYYGDTQTVHFKIKGANDIRWGIDIRGGVEAIFSPDIADADITDADMDAAKEIVETRLVNNNITDSEVFVDYQRHQVIVRFPWKAGETNFDPQALVEELGETALLTFCEGSEKGTAVLQGSKHVKQATAGTNEDGDIVVWLELTDEGTSLFSAATARVLSSDDKTISIWMDDELISNPTVSKQITDNICYIEGMESGEAAKELADKINAGSLPFTLNTDEKLEIITPTLGNEALNVMLIAGAIAFVIICILMIVKYRLCGIVSAIALMGQMAGVIACTSGFFESAESFTLTIPGIAGIILSIGMGVDANTINFERIKEEFRNGKTIDGAIKSGFKNSWSAILDGNVTIIIVSIVLMATFGTTNSIWYKLFSFVLRFFSSSITGAIYSFGFTLLTGVVFNFIMIAVSRVILMGISQFKALRKPWLYGGAKNGK